MRRDDPKAIAAFCLFDWANSAFTTLIVTFVYGTYFTKAMAADEVTGTALWSRGITATALVVALASPIVGAIADRGGRRMLLLVLSSLLCIAATAALTFVAPGGEGAALTALVLFVVANVGFELGMVFYNAFLPEIASPARIGRVSGWAWAAGYVGGLLCLVLALVALVQPEEPWFGIGKEAGVNIRAVGVLTAGWFALFALPFFLLVRQPGPRAAVTMAAAVRDLVALGREVGRYRDAARFLLARLVYNDGLNTIFAFGGIYAAGTFGMSFTEILIFGIVLNVAAGLGAFAFGFVDDRIGGKRTVLISVAALAVSSALAVAAPSTAVLWIAGIGIGLFAGPNQAASRSLLARFCPPDRETEFFGFFAFSGKLAAFLGPLFLGIATEVSGSQRAGVATVLIFFLAGGALLLAVDEKRGAAAASSPPGLAAPAA